MRKNFSGSVSFLICDLVDKDDNSSPSNRPLPFKGVNF